MSKHEGIIKAAGAASDTLDELLAALGRVPATPPDRRDAMAQFLSGDEGWRDARKALRGTFATLPTGATGLTPGEDK